MILVQEPFEVGRVSGQEKYELPSGVEKAPRHRHPVLVEIVVGVAQRRLARCLGGLAAAVSVEQAADADSPGCTFIGVVDQRLACQDQKIGGRLLTTRDRLAHRAHLFAQLA